MTTDFVHVCIHQRDSAWPSHAQRRMSLKPDIHTLRRSTACRVKKTCYPCGSIAWTVSFLPSKMTVHDDARMREISSCHLQQRTAWIILQTSLGLTHRCACSDRVLLGTALGQRLAGALLLAQDNIPGCIVFPKTLDAIRSTLIRDTFHCSAGPFKASGALAVKMEGHQSMPASPAVQQVAEQCHRLETLM